MATYEEWHEMKIEDVANRVHSLNDSTIAQFIESVTIMVDSGHYPREAFPEVQFVGRLLSNLRVGQKNVAAN